MKDYVPSLALQELEENFSDIAPPLNTRAAVLEAQRCLYCYDAPCTKACPTTINVPAFIRQIGTGDTLGAAKTILSQNILGGSCARVCPTAVLCEGACVYNGINGNPIKIGKLQRHAVDAVLEKEVRFFKKGASTGKSVAIVGAGPAGLSCAHEATRLGYACTVYEASDRPGGLNTWGVAGYKIDTDFAISEAQYIAGIGFEIKFNTPVGENPSVKHLLDQYDAVFLAIGLGETAMIGLPGEDLEGCLEALDFIRPTRNQNYEGCKVGDRVIVIGAGNTAIDVATAAVRLGAKEVTIVYRRTEEEMPAYAFEYELAKGDGVRFEWLTQPKRIVGASGRVTGVSCVKVAKVKQSDGQVKLQEISGSEFEIACDVVVMATGQNPLLKLLKEIPGLELKQGSVAVDPKDYRTSIEGLFAGGDCIKVAEVVNAAAHGRESARAIDRFLRER